MRTTTKIVLGAATVWPLTAWLILAVFVISNMFVMRSSLSQPERPLPVSQTQSPSSLGHLRPADVALIVLFGGTTALALGLLVFYLRDVSKNPDLDQNERTRWSSTLFRYNVLAMPAYWYLHVWRRSNPVRVTTHEVYRGETPEKTEYKRPWEPVVIEYLERRKWLFPVATGMFGLMVLAVVFWMVAEGATPDRWCLLIFMVGLLLAFHFGGVAVRAAIRDSRRKGKNDNVLPQRSPY
jgi:hypothetical protein